MSVCPIRNNKWSELLKEVGKVEAYRLFVRNGNETPDFGPFTAKEDVIDHLLKTYPDRLSKYAGDVHIKTGGDYPTYLKNISFIRAEIPKINKLYEDLLSIQMIPITKINERFGIGRSKAAVVNISSDALDKHYSIYEEAKEREREAGERIIEGEVLSLYEQRVENIERKIQGFLKNKQFKSADEASGNIIYISTFEGQTVEFMEEDDLRQTLSPKKEKSSDEGSLFDELWQEHRGDRLTSENREDFEKKKAIMLKNFPKIKNVIEDYSIASAGLLEANGTTIRVNPNKWTTDTIGHEIGHVLLDMLGGMNNPMVREARERLKGHSIEKRVYELYPELVEADDERLDKEILTTAIGRETTELFEEEQDRNWWERFLMRLFDRLKRLLGLEKNDARTLAKMVVGQRNIPVKDSDITTDVSYEHRVREYEVRPSEEVSRVEDLRRKALESLEKKYTIYRKKSIQQKVETIRDALGKLEDLKNDPIESLKTFQKFAIEETDKIYEDYSKLKRRKDKGEENVFNARTLSRWKDYVSGFDLLEEIIAVLRSPKSGMTETEITKLGDALDLEGLTEAVQRKKEIQNAFVEEGVDVISRFLLPYSSHITAKYKEIFEREYNKLSKGERSKLTVDEYIAEQLDINRSKIEDEGRRIIKQELTKAYGDINQLMRWLDNVLDSPDLVVSTMAKVIAEADHKSRLKQIEFRNEFLKKLRALEKFQSNKTGILKDDKKFYEFLIEKDDKGNFTNYLIDVYKNSMWEELRKYSDYLQSQVEAGKISYDEMVLLKRKWKNLNAPLRYKKFEKAKYDYIQTLVDKNLVTKEEFQGIKNNDNIFKLSNTTPELLKSWKRIDDIVKNSRASELITEWLIENTRNFRDPSTFHRFVFDEKKKKLVREDKGWYNPQWSNLVKLAGGDTKAPINEQRMAVKNNINKDPRIDFYNFLTNSIDEYQKLLPYSHRLHLRLPAVMKDFNQRIKSGDNIADILKGTVKRELAITTEYIERGDRTQITDESNNPVNFLPIYFTGEIDNKDQSYDIADIYFKYISMAIDHAEKSSILPEIEMTRFFINNRDVITRDSKGNVIKDAALRNKERVESGNKSLIAAQLNDWFDSVVYGQRTKDEGTINFLGIELDFGRAVDLINRYTALNLLGANFIQGTANVVLGSSLQIIEAFGKQFYSPKNLAKANGFYFRNMAGLLGDIGMRAPENVVNLLNERFDILNEYVGGKFRKNSKFRQLLSTNTLFFTSHAGEHYMQTKLMLAMLDTIKAKDKNGNILGSMLDVVKVENGKLIFKGKNGEAVVNFGEREQFEFEGKVKRVLSRLHGEYSDLGRVAIQRIALGRMAYMFRKFIVPGFRRRYGRKYVNNFQEEYVEGNYRTFFRFVGNLIKDLKTFQLSLMSENWKELTRAEKANVKRTLGEVVFLLSAIIMANVFLKLKSEADDDEEWLYSFLGYQALRFRSELGFFFNPQEAMRILRSPAASMSVVENIMKLTGQLIDPLWSGDLAFERYERGNWKGRLKINKTLTNFVPGMKQVYRLRDVEDQISWFTTNR